MTSAGPRLDRRQFLAASTAFAFVLACSPQAGGGTVVVGNIVPSTGPFADFGRKSRLAADMALEMVNRSGIGGRQLSLPYADTGGRADEAASLVRRLADQGAMAVLGPFSSTECEVAFPVGNQLGIPMIAPASAKPGVAAASRPFAFRTNVVEAVSQAILVPAWRQRYGIRTAVAVYDERDAISLSLGSDVLPEAARNVGISLVDPGRPLTFQTGDLDMGPLVARLRGLEFDGILLGAGYRDGITFLREARRQGIQQPVVGGNPLANDALPQQAGAAAEGVMAPSTFVPTLPSPEVQAFVEEFERRRRAAGIEVGVDYLDANVYDIVRMLAQAMVEGRIQGTAASRQQDRRIIAERLAAMDFPSLTGPLRFDASGDAVRDVLLLEVRDGAWRQYQPAGG